MAVSSIEKAADSLKYAGQGQDMQNMRAQMREETHGFSQCVTEKAHQPLRRQRRDFAKFWNESEQSY